MYTGIANPYGAVPEALKETRMTLRDIMQDYLANKVAESNLEIAKAKADVERASVEADIQKASMMNTLSLARLAQEANQFQQNYGLHERQVKLEEQTKPQQIWAQQEQARASMKTAEARAQEVGLIAAEQARKNQIVTLGQLGNERNIPKVYFTANGIDPNTRLRRADGEETMKLIGQKFAQDPALMTKFHQYSIRDKILELQEKMVDPTIPPDQKTIMNQQYNKLKEQFQSLEVLSNELKKGDNSALIPHIVKYVQDNPATAGLQSIEEVAAKFAQAKQTLDANSPSFDMNKIHEKYQREWRKISGQEDLDSQIKFYADAFKNLKMPLNEKQQIFNNADKLRKEGKPEAALNYLKKMHSIIVPKSISSNQQAGENTEGRFSYWP